MKEIAKVFALKCHNETNHLYDGKPYQVHLQMVVDTAERFIHLIPEQARPDVIAACWVHDTIEDTRQTYNDVKKETNQRIAELAYALTNEKGRSREERANDKYYDGINLTPFAAFVKLCDRIANFQYSVDGKSRMADLYKAENSHFVSKLWNSNYSEMFDYLLELERNI